MLHQHLCHFAYLHPFAKKLIKYFALLNYKVFLKCALHSHLSHCFQGNLVLPKAVLHRGSYFICKGVSVFCCPFHFTAWQNTDTALCGHVRKQIWGYLNHCHQRTMQSCRLHCTLEKRAKVVSTSYLKCRGNFVSATFPH